MNQIKISVILPVYNVEKYLPQCLDSIVNQTLRDIEILCIDDGSTDHSSDILARYAANDPRIRVIRQENAGAGAARNRGLALASGQYLSFLDSDDFFEPDMLETAYTLALRERADLVVYDSDQYCEATQTFKKQSQSIKKRALAPYSSFDHHSLTDNPFRVFIGWAWDKLFRTDFVREHGLTFQEQRTSNDLRFVFSAIVLAERISIADRVLAHQRSMLRPSLVSTGERSWECFYHALTALRENLTAYGMMHELEQDLINYALHFSLWNLKTITDPQKGLLFQKLKSEWFADLGILGRDRRYFYHRSEYRDLLRIMRQPYPVYLAGETCRRGIRRARNILHIGR